MVTINRVPLQWTRLQIWFLTNHCQSEHGIGLGSSPNVSPTLATKNRAELDLQNQPDLVVFGFQVGFYFPPSPHPLSLKNGLLSCLAWPVLHSPLSCLHDVLAWSVNIIKG